tara:strand:- start:12 stop:344 length:333 start_codon:yes stop_codon:yes gene_type:complete
MDDGDNSKKINDSRATERHSFKTQIIEGVQKYFYNGKEVSKKFFDKQNKSADEKQTDLLGISKEDYKKETMAERKKRAMSELDNFAEGGMVSKKKLAGRLAKRGYGAAKK